MSDADEDADMDSPFESDQDSEVADDDQSQTMRGNTKLKIDPKVLNDASEERTVFVRNLSFSTTSETLNESMSTFGPTVYCKICVDPLTEHSKGSAFIKFESKDDAIKCIEAGEQQSDLLYLDGRQLNVSLALTRSKLKVVQESRVMKNKDKRNLYLAKEGLIYPNSPAAEGVSQADLAKRLALETRKRKMLQNNHYFVSNTRLCIHNLPPNCDNKQLRKIFLNAVNEKSVRIIEVLNIRQCNLVKFVLKARVMYDRRKADNKFGKSKGFGFVEFQEHTHALKALRNLNNNPQIFSVQKRPIVEFSIENKVAINKKIKRQQKNQKKEQMSQTVEEEDPADSQTGYSGVHSRPNKPKEKIRAPKVNRKLGEMHKELKNRKKKIHMNKVKESNEKRHKQKVEKRNANRKQINESQDSHDLHYKKRKDIFKQPEGRNSNEAAKKKVPMVKKKVKWFSE